MDNLEERDKFLGSDNLQRMDKEEIDILKLKMWLKISQQINVQDQMTPHVNFT